MCSGPVGHHDRVPDLALRVLCDQFPRSGVHPANKLFYLTCQSCREVSENYAEDVVFRWAALVLPVKFCNDEAVVQAVQLPTPGDNALESLGLGI